MTAKRLAAIVAALLLLTAAPARADVVLAFGATSAKPANNQILDELRVMGAAFWQARGVPATAAGDTYLMYGSSGVAAYTWGADVYFIPDLLAYVQAHPADAPAARALCLTAFHEEGHTGGLPHSAHGVMGVTAEPPGTPLELIYPWECIVWARDRATAAKSAAAARARSGRPARCPAAARHRCTPASRRAAQG